MGKKQIDRTVQVFIELLESEKSIKELIEALYKEKMNLTSVVEVTCFHCKFVNLRNKSTIETITQLLKEANKKKARLRIPSIKCSSCRKRLIFKRKNKYHLTCNYTLKLELPENFLRSKSGHLGKGELSRLKNLKLIQSNKRKRYSINYERLFQLLPYWGQTLENFLSTDKKSAKFLKSWEKDMREISRSKIKELIREFIITRKDYYMQLSSIETMLTHISNSFGEKYPSEFKKLFGRGYNKSLTKREENLFLNFQHFCWSNFIEESPPTITDPLNFFSHKFNKFRYRTIVDKEIKIIKENGGDEKVNNELRAEL